MDEKFNRQLEVYKSRISEISKCEETDKEKNY